MNSDTVRFDVGGQVFRVSRSLLERFPDTMLARMSSDVWQTEQCETSEPIFIERDGERFRYVLDYMRDGGNVILPGGRIPKQTFLNELQYYGFTDIATQGIDVDLAFAESLRCIRQVTTDIQSEIVQARVSEACWKLSEEIRKVCIERDTTSFTCIERDTTSFTFYESTNKTAIPYQWACTAQSNLPLFDACLAKLGLVCETINVGRDVMGSIQCKKVELQLKTS